MPLLRDAHVKIQIEKKTTTQGHTFLFKINIENKYITQGHTYFRVRIQIENNHSSPGYEIALFGL